MSIHIQVVYTEAGLWQDLEVSGNTLQEIRQRGIWIDKRVLAIKYPDGRVWDFKLNGWRPVTASEPYISRRF